MATSFEKVYQRFTQKITDYKLLEIADNTVEEMMEGWLLSSLSKQRELRKGAYAYDPDTREFIHDLVDVEIELLALGMAQEWIEPQINSITLTAQFVSSNEEKFYAQHNHLNMLMNLQDKIKKEKKWLLSSYKSFHNKYLGTTEVI